MKPKMLIAAALFTAMGPMALAASPDKDMQQFRDWCLDREMEAKLRMTACTHVLAAKAYRSEVGMILFSRGQANLQLLEFDAAIRDFNESLVHRPNFAPSYNRRGLAYMHKKMYGQAIDDFKQSIELKPNFDAPMNNLAWLYATAEDPEYRKPSTALKLMTDVLWLSDSPRIRDTLAAAYAANGDFDMAEINQKLAISMLAPFNELDWKEDFEQRLSLYQQGLPAWTKAKSNQVAAPLSLTPQRRHAAFGTAN